MATICFVGSADDFVKFIKDIQALAPTEKAPSISESESAKGDIPPEVTESAIKKWVTEACNGVIQDLSHS